MVEYNEMSDRTTFICCAIVSMPRGWIMKPRNQHKVLRLHQKVPFGSGWQIILRLTTSKKAENKWFQSAQP